MKRNAFLHQTMTSRDAEGFRHLQQIVATLRGGNGCPWDIRQTPDSLKKYLREECQELIEAIDSGQEDDICEEIGDVFFILTMLTTMFTERQSFTIGETLERISTKMIRRHPHVFAGASTGDDQQLRRQWEQIKAEDKKEAAAKRSA